MTTATIFERDPQAAADVVPRRCAPVTMPEERGTSALGLQRRRPGLGSYEQTSWTWLHKLRRAMARPGRDRLAGEIEADESYVGGPEEGKRGGEVESRGHRRGGGGTARARRRAHPPSARQGRLRRERLRRALDAEPEDGLALADGRRHGVRA